MKKKKHTINILQNFPILTSVLRSTLYKMKSIQFDLEDLPHEKIFMIHYKEYEELDFHLLFKC